MNQFLFIYGPPASGKTTLGRLLAKKLNCTFFDLDEEIERYVGKSISEIFKDDGESTFRKYEIEFLLSLIRSAPNNTAVISLGGGTLCDEKNRSIVEKAGIVWCLNPPDKDELKRRIESDGIEKRPLGDKSEERENHYASFKSHIVKWFDTKNSLVIVGNGLGFPSRFVDYLFADFNASIYQSTQTIPRTFGVSENVHVIPSGEEYKTIDTIIKMWNKLAENSIGRKNCIGSFGGGVTSDLVGFAASTWMRGIDWVNFPTTLLSMVDACVGGKTGCDLSIGKNLVGSFHFPKVVFIDTDRLETLNQKELANGYAEMIKHSIIAGLPLSFNDKIPSSSEIASSLKVKLDIVEKDPFEKTDKRILLNCGHTIGHALEVASNFKYSHGEAVAIGCVEEAKLALKMGLTSEKWIEELVNAFSDVRLPYELPKEYSLNSLVSYMKQDKKHDKSIVKFALPCGLGDVRLVDIDIDKIG